MAGVTMAANTGPAPREARLPAGTFISPANIAALLNFFITLRET